MTRSQQIPALLLALVLSLGAAACGGSDEADGSVDGTGTTATTGEGTGDEATATDDGDGGTSAPESPAAVGDDDDDDATAGVAGESHGGVGGDGGEDDASGSADGGAPALASGTVSHLEITITHPADPGAVPYVVDCPGDAAATISPAVDGLDATAACNALELPDVRTRLVEGAPAGRMCTDIYGGPDEAHLVGTIDGTAVDTIVDRADGCAIDDWDRLLVDLLPAALGVTG